MILWSMERLRPPPGVGSGRFDGLLAGHEVADLLDEVVADLGLVFLVHGGDRFREGGDVRDLFHLDTGP